MDVEELIAAFDAGVTYRCGCEEGALPAAIIRGLREGVLDPKRLLWCETHGEPMLEGARAAAIPAIHWSSSD